MEKEVSEKEVSAEAKELKNTSINNTTNKTTIKKIYKNYIWLIVLILLVVIGVYLFSAVKSFKSIQGNVIKEQNNQENQNNIFKDIEEKLGFQGVRDPINKGKSSLFIKGTAFGVTKEASFNNWNWDLLIEKGKIIGFEGIIDSSSINTKLKWLDEKLIGEKVLNVEKYPEIKFKYLNLEGNEVIGDLTILGKTQEIRIPVVITEQSISGDFSLNLRPFNIESDKISKDVWVVFRFVK